jgi:catechol 2,3-dioxygenase-like lactoylglutathione lyase family enzyme
MALVAPGLFHRLGIAVEDVGGADAWFRRVMGCVSVAGTERPFQETPVAGTLDQEGATAGMLWHGGLPLLLLGAVTPASPVGRHISRWGTGMHSVAWEIEDMWSVEHLLRLREIRISGVNVPGRHFFMHPADTCGVLIEWTDTRIAGDPRRGHPVPPEGPGVIGGVQGIAWVTAVVTDASTTAASFVDLMGAKPVVGNPTNDEAVEHTVDLAVGDVTLRLVTPRSDASRYMPALSVGPRLWSYAVSVPDLDAALRGLEGAGIKVLDRVGSIAWTDPATTAGIPIEWTDAAPAAS